jgi:hypothetical protein
VLVLRYLAEATRADSLVRLRRHWQNARAFGAEIRRKAIEDTVEEVKNTEGGIFAPIRRQPVIGALLLPSGSAGIWVLLQYFR